MKYNRKTVLSIIGVLVLALLLLGTSYAFFEASSDDAVVKNVNIQAHTIDTLTFSISDNLALETNQDNFENGDANVSGEATTTAILTPNSKTGSATDHYYLSFYLKENTTVYSAANTNQVPEYLLQVFNSSNQLVTLNNLGTQKTVGSLTGYDITGKSGIFTILDNHEITASNNTATTETWRFVVTAINHNFNQNENAGKKINGKILVNKTGFDYCAINPNDCISLAVANMPTTVGKTVTPTCTGATASWNNKYNQLEVSGITTSKLDCTLTYTDATGATPLNTYLIGLNNTAQGEGQLVSENGYRYEGENPNNYVMFNNELWRIIGVFSTEYDSDNNGTTDSTANLVKIIRDESIGGLAWDKSDTNDWPNSSLYHLLNYEYYDWDTNNGTVSTYCYAYSGYRHSKCDYSVKGIQDGYRGMIVKSKWYLGGGGKSGYNTYTPDNIYSYERDADAIYSGRSASTAGYIGLMYESDYLYAVLSSDCARATNINYYNTASCSGKDWLNRGVSEWTITPSSDYDNKVHLFISNSGVGITNPLFGYSSRPALYLSSSVYRIGGSGTITDPYIIGM